MIQLKSNREIDLMAQGGAILGQALKLDNVDSRQYWVPPVHQQTAFRKFAPKAETLQNTNWLAEVSISLPIWSRMDDEVVVGICRAIQQIH